MTSGPLPANVSANSTLVWVGENRLIQAQVTGGATVNFIYDSQSRRIAETVGTTTKITVYDGWNPIAEYAIQNSTFTIQNSYLWGIDLSGTLQGAGGVGGLLMTSLITNNSITSNYFPTYDGNGNVSEYLNESGEVSAHYEYDPFGKTTVATGPKANDFTHRFSTKPLDATTGLYYYGYRYYDPQTGRWPSRDPIGEEGGMNLYGFVGNDGPNIVDHNGLYGTGMGYDGQDLLNHRLNPWTGKPNVSATARIRSQLEDIRRKYHRLFPGEENSDMRHCTATCEASKQVDPLTAQLAGVINEIQGLILWDMPQLRATLQEQRTSAFQLQDLLSNAKGGLCASDSRGCEECCRCRTEEGT